VLAPALLDESGVGAIVARSAGDGPQGEPRPLSVTRQLARNSRSTQPATPLPECAVDCQRVEQPRRRQTAQLIA